MDKRLMEHFSKAFMEKNTQCDVNPLESKKAILKLED